MNLIYNQQLRTCKLTKFEFPAPSRLLWALLRSNFGAKVVYLARNCNLTSSHEWGLRRGAARSIQGRRAGGMCWTTSWVHILIFFLLNFHINHPLDFNAEKLVACFKTCTFFSSFTGCCTQEHKIFWECYTANRVIHNQNFEQIIIAARSSRQAQQLHHIFNICRERIRQLLTTGWTKNLAVKEATTKKKASTLINK